MRRSILRDTTYPMGFNTVSKLSGVCSAITLSNIKDKVLAKLNKEEIMRNIEAKSIGTDIVLSRIKTVQITLNRPRTWCWGTPWKFAYSYTGNAGHCSVFYINFK
ncbi:MAG: hypothetical protein E6R13_07215 [Spirochaetes bacterium]|nr:MAG: hypothetical protein E6R13_07215 [Spirochaetota bacterium]